MFRRVFTLMVTVLMAFGIAAAPGSGIVQVASANHCSTGEVWFFEHSNFTGANHHRCRPTDVPNLANLTAGLPAGQNWANRISSYSVRVYVTPACRYRTYVWDDPNYGDIGIQHKGNQDVSFWAFEFFNDNIESIEFRYVADCNMP